MMSDKVSKSIEEALAQLHDERERIDGAIAKLEGFLGNLNGSKASRAKSKSRIASALRKAGRRRVVAKVRSRAGWTPEARQAAADRMRRYWEEQHKVAAENGGTTTRRGRRSTKSAPRGQVKERSRTGWTEDARAAAADRMRRYWEERKATKSSSLSH